MSVLAIVSCIHEDPKPQVVKDYYFKVSPTSSVQFSPGILMYDTLAQEYHFGSTLAKPHLGVFDGHWVDRFVWGHGNDPLFDGEDADDYQVFYDWGNYPIDDYPIDTWRTLTADEWNYLLLRRTHATQLCCLACVDSINGFILLPDNWTDVEDVPLVKGFVSITSWNGSDSFAEQNNLTFEQWQKLEEAGAVFLPTSTQYRSSIDFECWTASYEWDVVNNRYHVVYYNINPLGGTRGGFPCGLYYPVRLVKNFVPKK